MSLQRHISFITKAFLALWGEGGVIILRYSGQNLIRSDINMRQYLQYMVRMSAF